MIKPITGTFFEFDHHNRAEGKYSFFVYSCQSSVP